MPNLLKHSKIFLNASWKKIEWISLVQRNDWRKKGWINYVYFEILDFTLKVWKIEIFLPVTSSRNKDEMSVHKIAYLLRTLKKSSLFLLDVTGRKIFILHTFKGRLLWKKIIKILWNRLLPVKRCLIFM